MSYLTEHKLRTAIAAFIAVVLSSWQFKYFDCSKLPGYSLFGGAVTLFLVYAVAEALRHVITSKISTDRKLGASAGILLVGGSLVFVTGYFTMITHMCP